MKNTKHKYISLNGKFYQHGILSNIACCHYKRRKSKSKFLLNKYLLVLLFEDLEDQTNIKKENELMKSCETNADEQTCLNNFENDQMLTQ